MQRDKILYFSSVFICLLWLIYNQIFLQLPPDTGDGIMHFFIAQVSWEDSTFFLHHWGKPLYILLSSPFAQLGFNGTIAFNFLVFYLTVFFAWKMFNHWRISIQLALLFPFFLLFTHDYNVTLLSALTEPLFSLFLLVSTWFLIRKNYVLFAFFIGCLPFLRSEGQLPVLMAFGILILYKE